MRRLLIALTILISAPACPPAMASAAPCQTQTFEGSHFTVCRYDPATDTLTLAQSDRNGKPLRTFARLENQLGHTSRQVKFAANAGMFGDAGQPIGLHIENGKVRRALNVRSGNGNFYMMPNGVFYTTANGSPHIAPRDTFAGLKETPVWATQSGPMLVVDGKLNNQFAPDGTSKYIRNAVGVSPNGTAAFVISEAPVSFGRLARFFRDALGCRNALYLDGAVSSLWVPTQNRRDSHTLLGPLLVVAAKPR